MKVMALQVEEFIRRFLLHVLPKGLMRIRYYGFLANSCRTRKLSQIRTALATPDAAPDKEEQKEASVLFDGYLCSKCRQGMLRSIAELPPLRWEGG